MKRSLQVGITGGIGAGKSLTSSIFAALGVPVFDSDRSAKRVMTTDMLLISQIKNSLGDKAYLDDNSLNKEFISDLAFSSPEKISVLNALVHPRVGEDYNRWLAGKETFPYVLKEAALLFESGSYKDLDLIIVVTAPEDVRIKRVLNRDPQRDEKGVRDIIKNQMNEEEKAKRADIIIENDESKLLIPQILMIDKALTQQAVNQK
jgi:dephospho-CoA kinase